MNLNIEFEQFVSLKTPRGHTNNIKKLIFTTGGLWCIN